MGMQQTRSFLQAPESIDVVQTLRNMMEDEAFNTPSSFSADTTVYPDNQMPFIDKHRNYLNKHPKLNPEHYLSNLKLMARKR